MLQQEFFAYSSGGWTRSRSRLWEMGCLVRTHSLVCRQLSLLYLHMVGGGRVPLRSLLQGHMSHSWGHYPHDPAISHWALGFSMNFGGAQTFRPRQRGLLVLKMEPKQIYINSQPINSHRCPYKSPRALDINLKWWLSDKTLLGKGCVEWRTGPLNPRDPDSENTGRREGREISLPFLLNF